jgi:hypothetical protein
MDNEELEGLCEIVASWSEDMATYKGREGWFEELKMYARERGLVVPGAEVPTTTMAK